VAIARPVRVVLAALLVEGTTVANTWEGTAISERMAGRMGAQGDLGGGLSDGREMARARSAISPAPGAVPAQPSPAGLAFVGVGVMLFATSPVLVRYAAPLTPFQITFGRMATAGVCLMLAALATRQPIGPARGEWPRFAGYGLIAALHFLLYIAALSFTTIAHALVLVYTAPVFVTFFAELFLRERIPRRKYLGLPVVVGGLAILAGLEPHMTWRMALGDLLALGSAVCFGLYSIAGRRERARYPLLRYAGTVYALAAVWLAPFALARSLGTDSAIALGAVIALGVFPLAIGHTLYNASLRRVHPTYVNLVATQEVTGGIVLGALLLGEWPPLSAIVGAVLSLVGVGLTLVLE
jgi:drug/metabolite transporter (DMT)-like permease